MALITKDNKDWASIGDKIYMVFPFNGDYSRIKEMSNAVEILIAGWSYLLLKPNQIEFDLDTFLNNLSKSTIVWSTTNSINQIKKDFKDFGDSSVKDIVKEIAKKKGYELIKKGIV